MPKRRTPLIKDYPYHVYNRGVAKQNIFLSERDLRKFSGYIKKYKEKLGIEVLCHTLMPNHFHFILWQKDINPINEFMRFVQVSYAMYFNKKYNRVGPIYQNRFKAKVITSDTYLLQLMKYIHRNPIEILGNNQKLEDYKWSSYPHYLGLQSNGITSIEFICNFFSKKSVFKDIKKFTEKGFLDSELEKFQDLIFNE